jgi:NAD-dependent deacetylase
MNQLAAWLKDASKTVVFTGAGMSTESGLPDFRSSLQGIWRGKDPAQFASTYALHHNRDVFVEFYRMRIEGLLKSKPHEGHAILARWEREGIIHGIITQNVDGFHQQAGNKQVAELHGTLSTVRCMVCGQTYPSAQYLQPDGTVCSCGGFLRPSVVLFGEALPEAALRRAEEWTEEAELFIVLGSSLQVSPANLFPQQAKARGARLVIVNMEPTELDDWADLVIHGKKIGDVLRQVEESLR